MLHLDYCALGVDAMDCPSLVLTDGIVGGSQRARSVDSMEFSSSGSSAGRSKSIAATLGTASPTAEAAKTGQQ